MATDKQHTTLNVPTLRFPEFSGEWKEVKIGNITTKVGSGVTPKGGSSVYTNSGHIFIRSQNVDNGAFLLKDVAYIDEATHQKQKSTELVCGDVLLNITGASIGRSAVVNSSVAGGNVNQHVCIIRVIDSISPNFLCNYLLSYRGQKQIDSFQAGGNREGLNFEQIKSIKFKMPTTLEQNKITSLLSKLDERIATQKKVIEKLQSLIGGISHKLFLPKPHWGKIRIGECCEIKSGYSGVQSDHFTKKVTRIETISNGLIDISKVGYVENNNQLSDYKLQVGDILFSNINSVSHIGKTAFVDKDYDLYHGMNLLRLTAKSNILAKYLFYQLNTTILKKKFISICNQAVSQASINQTDLGKVTVHIPPLSEQYNVVKILDTLYLKLMIEQEINSRFQSQKQHLLSAMFM